MGKSTQDWRDFMKSGPSTQDIRDFYFRRKSMQGVHDPFKELTLLDMLKSGAFARDLKHGGIASLAPRRMTNYAYGGLAGILNLL